MCGVGMRAVRGWVTCCAGLALGSTPYCVRGCMSLNPVASAGFARPRSDTVCTNQRSTPCGVGNYPIVVRNSTAASSNLNVASRLEGAQNVLHLPLAHARFARDPFDRREAFAVIVDVLKQYVQDAFFEFVGIA